MTSALAERRLAAVSREAAASRTRGGARLLVNGAVERAGATLRLRLTIDDAQAGLSLWSATLERPVAEAAGLQAEAAARVADVLTGAVYEVADNAARDPRTLGALLNMVDMSRLGQVGAPQYLELARQLVKSAPGLSRAHSDLAWALASTAASHDRDAVSANHEEARREARRALEIDPHNGDAYTSLYIMTPRGDLRRRFQTLREGLTVDPQQPDLVYFMADMLSEVGRLREALPLYQTALSLDPLAPNKTSGRIYALSASGRIVEAEALAAKAFALWPDRSTTRRAWLHNAMLYWSPDKALAALDAVQKGQPLLGPEGERAWRAFAEARRAGDYPPAVRQLLRAAALSDQIDKSNAVGALAMAGDVDGAFAVASLTLDRGEPLFSSNLFQPAAAAMRTDPRFLDLVDRLDVGYFWRSSHELPDYCEEPGHPPSCETISTRWWNGSRNRRTVAGPRERR